MNADHLEYLIATILHPFAVAIMETKEELVSVGGAGTDILPTFAPYRTVENCNILGSCGVLENRMVGMQVGRTRWMNLCRQVVRLTHSDAALIAVEIVTDEPPVDTLELTLVTPESVTTTLRPYRYGLGRQVQWLGQAVPDNGDLHRGGNIEIEGARQAWTDNEVAYPASVKYLSELCGCTWMGDQGMLDAIRQNYSRN